MPDLNRNELEALRILWSKGAALKPAEIQADFAWPIENATLRSALALLVEKGQVAREKRGKAFHYRAKSSPERILTRMARSMAEVFSGGSAAGLIAQLMRVEKVTPQEIEELRRIAGESASTGPEGTQATVGQAFQPASTSQPGRPAAASQQRQESQAAQAGKPAPLTADRTRARGGKSDKTQRGTGK